jgi:hypothetical protein
LSRQSGGVLPAGELQPQLVLHRERSRGLNCPPRDRRRIGELSHRRGPIVRLGRRRFERRRRRRPQQGIDPGQAVGAYAGGCRGRRPVIGHRSGVGISSIVGIRKDAEFTAAAFWPAPSVGKRWRNGATRDQLPGIAASIAVIAALGSSVSARTNARARAAPASFWRGAAPGSGARRPCRR